LHRNAAASSALWPDWTLHTLRTFDALVTLRALHTLRTLVAFDALWTLRAGVAFGTLRPGRADRPRH
jgi:hypothetical protein